MKRSKPGKKKQKNLDPLHSETRTLSTLEPSSPIDRVEELRTLSIQFIKNRLENSSTTEGVKKSALLKLGGMIDEISSPATLLRIIDNLNRQTTRDVELVTGQSPEGGGAGGDLNIFLGGGQQPGAATLGRGAPALSVTKEQMALIDTILQMTEAVVHDTDKGGNGQIIEGSKG